MPLSGLDRFSTVCLISNDKNRKPDLSRKNDKAMSLCIAVQRIEGYTLKGFRG